MAQGYAVARFGVIVFAVWMGDPFGFGDAAVTDTEAGFEEAASTRRAKVRRAEPTAAVIPALPASGSMDKLSPESMALCQLLMGHIDQKGTQTEQKIDLLRGHLDSQIQRLDGKTDELKKAAAEDSKEIRTLIKRNQEFADARLAALELSKGAMSTGGGSTTASLGSGNSVCFAASSQDDMYRPAPNRLATASRCLGNDVLSTWEVLPQIQTVSA